MSLTGGKICCHCCKAAVKPQYRHVRVSSRDVPFFFFQFRSFLFGSNRCVRCPGKHVRTQNIHVDSCTTVRTSCCSRPSGCFLTAARFYFALLSDVPPPIQSTDEIFNISFVCLVSCRFFPSRPPPPFHPPAPPGAAAVLRMVGAETVLISCYAPSPWTETPRRREKSSRK